MAQLTTEDLKSWATSYESTREVGDVLIGEDTARPIMEAVSSGNDAALQSLLSQPQWSKILVEKPHRIYQEASSEGANGVRRVMAAPTSNLEWALTVAAQNGNGAAAAVSTFLACAKQYHDINAYDVVNYSIINQIIRDGHADIFKALVSSDPKIANFPLLHGTLPLYEAVRLRQPDVVAVLLECGADPFHPVQESKQLQGYRSSLLSWAAYADGPRITELLLQHRVPIANSAALHTAASTGALDTMRVLIQHGADVNEALATMRNWTPLHFAHSRGRVDAVKLLEQSGAKADAKDGDGKTPAQLLEERNT